MTKDKILDKVRKLFRLGNNEGATAAEAERALAQAHKMLAKYNLDIADIEEEAEDEGRGTAVVKYKNRPFSRRISANIARLFFCEYLHFKGKDQHVFIGRHTNVVTASEMSTWVIKAALKEARSTFSTNAEHTAFLYGVGDIIAMKVDKIIAASRNQTSSGSKALVLADLYSQEKTANEEFMNMHFNPSYKKPRKRMDLDTKAYGSGVAYGESINLNRQLG